jgi:hypothetical protein
MSNRYPPLVQVNYHEHTHPSQLSPFHQLKLQPSKHIDWLCNSHGTHVAFSSSERTISPLPDMTNLRIEAVWRHKPQVKEPQGEEAPGKFGRLSGGEAPACHNLEPQKAPARQPNARMLVNENTSHLQAPFGKNPGQLWC